MDKFLFDDFKGGKGVVNMGNKKKELDVKSLIIQNDQERNKRQLIKLQAESATLIQSHLRKIRVQSYVANRIFNSQENTNLSDSVLQPKKVSYNLNLLIQLMKRVPEKKG